MNRIAYRNVKENIIKALALIKEAIDISIPMLRTNQRNNVVILWEAFAREIIFYVRRRSEDTGMNLSGYISIKRIFFK